MFVSRAREAPSVASTRVLKTHRMNSVETFRLQERVKTIDFESQHNYSQILDEIDGVRQNLVKIKGVKKNVGVSVERRKLLRDKGLRILPNKQKGDVDYFTVRTSNGKDVNIPCSDFYDGDTLRKQLNIDKYKLSATPSLELENSDSEELIDFPSAESRGRSFSVPGLNLKEFRYRKITPPIRPGSRRNFRDVDDENSEDDEKLLTFENISNRERKYGILRPQTAYLERDRLVMPRPRSRTCPANVQESEAKMPVRKVSRKSSVVAGNNRKKSRSNDSTVSEMNISEKSVEQQVESDNHQPEVSNNNVVLEETISLKPSLRPTLRPRSMTVASSKRSTGISRTVVGMRRMSLDTVGEGIQLPPSPSGGQWFHPETPETSPRLPKKSVTIANEENSQREPRKFSKQDRKVSWKDNVQDRNDNINNNKITRSKLSDASLASNESFTDRAVVRKASSLSANSQQSNAGRAQSAPQARPGLSRKQTHTSRRVSKGNGRRSSQDFVYDARPDKALSKGYMTMQMTIGNKQVKVYVPKFSPGECLDDVTVERARAKSAVKAGVGVNRPIAENRK
ncbi:uncharacterized protein LOC144642032 [Oculina patagonica]